MAKRKTLPKDFEQLVEAGNEQEIKKCIRKMRHQCIRRIQ